MNVRASNAEIKWALEYDGYRRLAHSPETLTRLVAPAREAFRVQGRVPDWCGVDFLRGWAFLLVREDYHVGGGSLGDEWAAVLDALRRHPDARLTDRPPTVLVPKRGA